jgi:hypothetical protein
MRPIIIGIHGLDNKPEADILRDWWEASISEGLARHYGGRKLRFRFELVYWADLRYPAPADPAGLLEPYVAAAGSGPLPRCGLSLRKVASARIHGGLGKVVEKVFEAPVAKKVVRGAVRSKMPDLYGYKHEEELREAVQQRLIKRLRAARRWRRQVMVIAHSMGSIVAYEVLRDAGRVLPGLEVSYFVTVGSPLGLAEFKEVVAGSLCVPECVARWSNYADPKDRVARWDTSLSEDYKANSRGVTISDHLVVNGYVSPAGKSNPHKIFGYLRTPEMSELIAGFCR